MLHEMQQKQLFTVEKLDMLRNMQHLGSVWHLGARILRECCLFGNISSVLLLSR